MLKTVSSFFAVLLVVSATMVAGAADLDGVQCVVANKPATEGKSADYKNGKVYFCCGGCAGKFAKNTKKFEVKANHQLVATKQFTQTACPFSGNDIDAEVHTMVAGTKVSFCCDGCKGKVESAEDDAAKIKLVFSNKNFAKGFKKKSGDEG